MMIKRFILLIFLFSFGIHAQEKSAFQDGEWLQFKISYGWFNATTATLKVKKEHLDGKELYHVIGKGKTTGLLDIFFKVRDNYESYVHPESIKPYKFIRKVNEGGYTKNKAIYFDHETLKAEVHNYKNDTISEHKIKRGTQDMISALYNLREEVDIYDLQKGDEFTLNLFFDEDNFDFKTVYLRQEKVETKFGTINCLVFRPYVKAGRVFEEKESVTIWISKDENKIPVKIEAKLSVGSLVARLNAFKGLANSFKISQQ